MTAERWKQVREILYAASQLETRLRCGYLDENCSGDSSLREEVERLLSALDQSGGFLEPDSRDPADPEGLRIGPYLVLGLAGRGGMGVVYHAVRDDEYRQEVAIKLVRAGAETDFLIARFRLERQALALLNHPNIARLMDGGTTADGRPYLVMEWVEGQLITEYCQAHGLGLRERLQLFLDVGDAVEHAHRNLVVHRDLKPSNILITLEGRPKLLDFGIAKIFSMEAASVPLTLAGTRMLTPHYASPEQVRGEVVTTATDVYSLGAVLYEILTGNRPLKVDSNSPLEIERAVCTREPAPMSSVTGNAAVPARDLRGDLDNIVLKAMQKEPQRRYGSVNQFCDDIRRHLAGHPVVARKDTLAYRTGKFVRRHRAGVLAATFILAAVFLGTASTLWEARVAVQQRGRAERRFNDVRKLANSFLFEFDDAIKDLPGSTPARSLVVKRALEYLDGLAAEGRGDRSLQMEIARAYQRVGAVQGDPMFPNLGDSKGALASSYKSLTILEALSHGDPGNQDLRLALAATHQQISDILDFSGDTAGAVDHSGRALRIYGGVTGSLANERKFRIQLIAQTYHHANLLKLTGALEEAAAEYRRSADLSGQLISAYPSDIEGKIHLATSFDGLGGVLQEKGDTAGALETRRKGLGIREELAAVEPHNAHFRRQLAFSHHNVGLSLVEAGDLPAALAHFRQELTLFESLSSADPKDVQARRNQSLAHKQIGDLLMRNGDVNEAFAQYRRCLDIDRALSSADPGNSQALLDLSFSEGKFGSALGKMGKPREAMIFLSRGVATQEMLSAKDPHHILLYGHLANSYTRLAECLLESGDTTAAVDYYRKAVAARLKLSEKNLASSSNRGALAECYTNLGSAVERTDRMDALKQYNRAVELLEPLAAADRSNAQYRIGLADALARTARLYARFASAPGETPALRLQQWTKAQSYYQRSQILSSEMDRGGKLPLANRRRLRDIAREMAECDNTLSKLHNIQ